MRGANFRDPRTFIFLYLSLNLLIALGPSKADFKNASLGICVIVVGIVLSDLVARDLGKGNIVQQSIVNRVWPLLSFVAGFLGVLIILSILVRMAVWVLEILAIRKPSPKPRR